MRILVIFVLAAEGAAGVAGGWFDMAIATGNGRFFRDRREQGIS